MYDGESWDFEDFDSNKVVLPFDNMMEIRECSIVYEI